MKVFATLAVTLYCAGCTTRVTNSQLDAAPRVLRVRDCSGPATSLEPSLVATLAPRTGGMQPDDQWADIAAVTPGGFGGILYRKGKPVVVLARPSEAAAAKAALAPLIPSFPIREASIQPARWDFAQLVDWYNYLMQRTPLWSLGVNGGDKSESDNRIKYRVTDSTSLYRLRALLDSIAIPCDLVLLEIARPFQIR